VEGSGRYAPWRNEPATQSSKLTRSMIDLILAGKKDIVTRNTPGPTPPLTKLPLFPSFKLTDLSAISPPASLWPRCPGRILGHWCPPCRSTLRVARHLQRQARRQTRHPGFASNPRMTRSAPPSFTQPRSALGHHRCPTANLRRHHRRAHPLSSSTARQNFPRPLRRSS